MLMAAMSASDTTMPLGYWAGVEFTVHREAGFVVVAEISSTITR